MVLATAAAVSSAGERKSALSDSAGGVQMLRLIARAWRGVFQRDTHAPWVRGASVRAFVNARTAFSGVSTGIDFIGLLNPASTAAALGDSSPTSTPSSRSGLERARRRRMPGLSWWCNFRVLRGCSFRSVRTPCATNSPASGSTCFLASSTSAASSATVPVSRWVQTWAQLAFHRGTSAETFAVG